MKDKTYKRHPGFFKTREDTKDWLDKMGVENYTINDDLIVDVDGNVFLYNKNLDYIPVQFGLINGYFICSYNNLTSLEGCPTEVSWDFDCSNNSLTYLEHCPTEVGGYFDCQNNNLTSLKGCPTKVGGYFDCQNNTLTSLKGCPTEVVRYFSCSNNNLKSLEHCPTEVDRDFYCDNNNLTSLKGCPIEVGGSFVCSNNSLTFLEYSITQVGGDFYCYNNIIVSEIPKDYLGRYNPSWKTSDPDLISIRFFDKLEGLDFDTKVDVLSTLKKLYPEFYNSAAFQAYNPDSMLGRIKRSKEATGGLFDL